MFLSSGIEKTQNGDKLGRPSIDDLIQSLSLQIGQQKTKDLSSVPQLASEWQDWEQEPGLLTSCPAFSLTHTFIAHVWKLGPWLANSHYFLLALQPPICVDYPSIQWNFRTEIFSPSHTLSASHASSYWSASQNLLCHWISSPWLVAEAQFSLLDCFVV